MGLLNNRKITVTVDKKDQTEEDVDPEQFHKNLILVKHHIEDLGIKILLGIGVYIFMDTCRQVKIEKTKKES